MVRSLKPDSELSPASEELPRSQEGCGDEVEPGDEVELPGLKPAFPRGLRAPAGGGCQAGGIFYPSCSENVLFSARFLCSCRVTTALMAFCWRVGVLLASLCCVCGAFGQVIRLPDGFSARPAVTKRATTAQAASAPFKPLDEPLDELGARIDEDLPLSARCRMERTDAGTLVVTFAPPGGVDLAGAAFSVAWFSAVVLSTFAASATLLSCLFMLPFWVAGGAVAKQSIVDPRTTTTLKIGEFGWSLVEDFAVPGGRLLQLRSADGPTKALRGATLEWRDGAEGYPRVCELALVSDRASTWPVGRGASAEELKAVAGALNREVDARRAARLGHALLESRCENPF